MALKAGDLIHIGGQVLLDRLQTAGAGLNIPIEKIYELGNFEGVGQTRDIADLTFTLESIDVSPEMEAMLVGAPTGLGPFRMSEATPFDLVSQFKAGMKAAEGGGEQFEVVGSVVSPFLYLESMSWRYGLRDNAGQTATLRGDGLFMARGGGVVMEVEGDATPGQEIVLSHDGGTTPDDAAVLYTGDSVNGDRYALSVSIVETGQRLTPGNDYTEDETAGVVTLTLLAAVPATRTIRVTYQSANSDPLVYLQAVHAAASATRPAAVKGKDIEIRVGGNTIGDRWSSVQSVNVDYRVNLERDEEMGSQVVVDQDFDVPEVTGTIEIKPRDFDEFMTRMYQIANVTPGEVVGPYTSQPLSLDVIIHSPEDGSVLKTLHVPDARFTLPGFQGRVQTKLTMSLPFDSDTGQVLVYGGART